MLEVASTCDSLTDASPDPVCPVTSSEARCGPQGGGGGGEQGHTPPSLPLPENFVFPKHKTWKWLRKMEPPNDHCLRWEWVSRKQIGVGGGPHSCCTPAGCLYGDGSSCLGVGGREEGGIRSFGRSCVCIWGVPGPGLNKGSGGGLGPGTGGSWSLTWSLGSLPGRSHV